jgi:ferric-dicitrate binding protein FerR (iron transport regulator)
MYYAVEGTPAVDHNYAGPNVRDRPVERRVSVAPPWLPEADHSDRDTLQNPARESGAEQARAIKASTDAAARRAVEAVIARAAEQATAARLAEPTRQRPRESRRRTVLKWLAVILAVILIVGAALVYGAASSHKSDTYQVRCRDGTYSEAGGHSGACSWHGGEAP